MRLAGVGALVVLVAGAAFLVDAVLHGRASLTLVVIVPVLSGGSAEFLLGVVLLVVGLFLLPLAFWEPVESEPLPSGPETPVAAPPSAGGAGGVVLLGPVPIFFGTWKNVSRRVRLLAAVVGAVVLALLVAGFLWAVR
jgi:uncharacterized membrane protein